MVENQKRDKATKAIKAFLDSVKLEYEDTPHFHLSRNFGKQKAWFVRAWWAAFAAVVNFCSDVYAAIKVIIKEIM